MVDGSLEKLRTNGRAHPNSSQLNCLDPANKNNLHTKHVQPCKPRNSFILEKVQKFKFVRANDALVVLQRCTPGKAKENDFILGICRWQCLFVTFCISLELSILKKSGSDAFQLFVDIIMLGN